MAVIEPDSRMDGRTEKRKRQHGRLDATVETESTKSKENKTKR